MKKRRMQVEGLLFALPSILGFFVFFLLILGYCLLLSFVRGSGNFTPVGLENYRSLLVSTSFRLAAGNTLCLVVAGIPLLLVSSYALAHAAFSLQKKNVRGVGVLFSLNLCAMVIPSSTLVSVLRLLADDHGIINTTLMSLGLEPVSIMKGNGAFALLLLIYLWKNYSYCMVVFYTGLRALDPALWESAAMDGAGSWRRLFSITLPQLAATIFFAFLMALMGVFKVFRESWLLFGDYPPESVYLIQNFMNNNFLSLNYTRISTLAILIMMMIGWINLIYLHHRRRNQ